MRKLSAKDVKYILAALQKMPTDALQRGMAAFSHPPRGQSYPTEVDKTGCFVYAAYSVAFSEPKGGVALSEGYEHFNEWFHGECLRELAERGVVAEPVPTAEEVA